MDLKFEKRYDKKVKKIEKLKEALKVDPENEALKEVINAEEDKLYKWVIKSAKVFEEFILLRPEEFYTDEENY